MAGVLRTVRRSLWTAPRAGFSLMELMLVLAIIAILMAVVSWNVLGQGDKAKARATRATLHTIAGAIDSYHLEYSAYPPTLNTLVTAKIIRDMKLKDGWDSDLLYDPHGANKDRPYVLKSAGPDKQPQTEDDIDVWTMDKQ